METLPATLAVTSPDDETVAMAPFPELQPITRPVSTLLLASRVAAESCTVAPTSRLALDGVTDTDATGIGAGALTLSAEALLLPSLEALIIALPEATALTVPAPSTVAIAEFELSQVTTRSAIGFPLASSSVAVAWAVCPVTTAEGLSVTITVAMGVGGGGVTAMAAWPETPSLTALTRAVPGATAEITPESLTLAIDALDVNQVTGRSVRTTPFASLGVAVARADCPAASEAGTVMETDATGVLFRPTSTTEVPYEEQAATAAKTRPVTARMKVRIGCVPLCSVFRRLD
jgi:hypothetical protein